jgi:hypothetical protein
VDSYPGTWTCWHALGDAQVCLGEVEGAITPFERVVEMEPPGEDAETVRAILTKLREPWGKRCRTNPCPWAMPAPTATG